MTSQQKRKMGKRELESTIVKSVLSNSAASGCCRPFVGFRRLPSKNVRIEVITCSRQFVPLQNRHLLNKPSYNLSTIECRERGVIRSAVPKRQCPAEPRSQPCPPRQRRTQCCAYIYVVVRSPNRYIVVELEFSAISPLARCATAATPLAVTTAPAATTTAPVTALTVAAPAASATAVAASTASTTTACPRSC